MRFKILFSPSRFEQAIQAANDARDRQAWSVALEKYRVAMSMRPRQSHLCVQAANMAKELGDYAQAELLYLYALRLSGIDDIYLQLGHLEKLQGRMQAALSHYARAAEDNPQNADAIRERDALDQHLRNAPLQGN